MPVHSARVDAPAMPNDDRENRYSHDSGSGTNQPKRHERKERTIRDD